VQGHRIGYVRVSSFDQNPERQLEQTQVSKVFTDKASGKDTQRPQLEALLSFVREGDTVVVHSMDRLARNLDDLRRLVQKLTQRGVRIEFLKEGLVFTGEDSPMANLMLSVMGAFAEFERALIRERTKAGLASARTKGRVGGNPGLRARDPAALRKVRLARQDGYMERLNETAQDWVPHVRRLRPDMAWEDVLRIVNGPLPRERQWTQSRLLRAVNAYVRDGFLPPTVLDRAGRRETDDGLPAIVAAIKGADPDITLQAICTRLEAMRERSPRGRTSWQPSSVKMLLERAERLGLLA
jgi:DNA invertase Pin-like site-specific DNA recombinase